MLNIFMAIIHNENQYSLYFVIDSNLNVVNSDIVESIGLCIWIIKRNYDTYGIVVTNMNRKNKIMH